MRKMLALCALVALLAAGCGAEEPSAGGAVPGAEEEILLTVNDREVPAWRYFCWLDRAVSAMAARCDGAGLAPDWAGEEGKSAKEQALSDTALYAVVEAMAEEQGVALTEEERAALDTGPWAALPRARAEELAAVGGLYGKLCTLAQTPGSAMAPGKEELEAFGAEAGYITLDRILVPAGEGAADKAAELFAQINGGGGEAFEAAKTQSADSLGPRTFLPGDGTFAPSLEESAAALDQGQLSGILESAEGYSILRRLPTDTAGLALPWLDARLEEEARQARIQVTDRYDSLDMEAYAAALLSEKGEKESHLSSS